MDYGIFDLLKLIGSLGIFLYGMKLMSEALQKVAGSRMQHILAAMTSNRFKGVMTGVLITAIIQSSSATTVMVVSFVNAGLLNLIQSIGVIMGANVGTTMTSWLISILGFKVSMAEISLPLIGLSLPLLFSQKRSRKSWGELVIGFGLLFIGLDFLQASMPNLDEHPEMFGALQSYTDMGYASYLLFLLIGTVLTIIIQSSSATMALTLVMCANGWVSFDIAAAMVLGENIGTTVTANLAAMVANTAAKRAAMAHFFFNVFGVVWVMAIFPFFLDWIKGLSIFLGIGNPNLTTDAVPMALSLFHTIFNIANLLVLIWFTRLIARLVSKVIPDREKNEQAFTLKHIKTGLLSTPEASLFQARQEVSLYSRNTLKMFRETVGCMEMPAKDYDKQFEHLSKLEDESDEVEVEIANYLTKVAESRLTTENTQYIRAMYTIVSEVESIADSTLNMAKAYKRRNDQHVVFSSGMCSRLKQMYTLVDECLAVMCVNLDQDYKEVNAKKAYEMENRINNFRMELRQEHLRSIEEKLYDYPTGILYSDLYSECEKIGDYAINVTQAIKEVGYAE